MVINIVAMAVYQYLDIVKDVPPVLIVGSSWEQFPIDAVCAEWITQSTVA